MIYRLNLDINNYLGIFVDEDELDDKVGDILYPEGYPIADDWEETPEGSLYDASGKERSSLDTPDIASWVGNLALSPKAFTAIGEHLTAYGEFLPVTINGEDWQVLNITHTRNDDVIDTDKSEQDLSGGIYMGLKALAFNEDRLDKELIFRCKYDQGVGQFATEAFKTLIEENHLSGIIFSEDLVK